MNTRLEQISSDVQNLGSPDEVYPALIAHCRAPEHKLGDEWNGALSDIAAEMNCTESQIDEICWFGIEDEPEPTITEQAEKKQQPWSTGDHHAIFGVGDVKFHEHDLTPALKHGEACSKCGCAESDGAMFTTLKGSGICDDCV